MQLSKDDLAVFVYNLAVILSAAWVFDTLQADSTVATLGVGIVLAVAWAAYFRWDVATRLGSDEEPVDEE